MKFWFDFVLSLPPIGYMILFVISGVAYMLFVAPFIFKFYLVPKINKRYGVKIQAKASLYRLIIFPSFVMPPWEISFYIFLKTMKLQGLILKNPIKGTYYEAMKEINYDINDSGRLELFIGCITAIVFLATIICGVIFAICS